MSMRTVIDCVEASLKNSEDKEAATNDRLLGALQMLEESEAEVDIAKEYVTVFFEVIALGLKLDLPILDLFAIIYKARYRDRNREPDAVEIAQALENWKIMKPRLRLREEGDIIKNAESNNSI